MIPSMGTVDPVIFTQHYEALRAWMLDGPLRGTRPAGLALVLRRGLPAWLDGAALWLPTPEPATSALTARADAGTTLTTAPVVQVLATMVERYREEGTS